MRGTGFLFLVWSPSRSLSAALIVPTRRPAVRGVTGSLRGVFAEMFSNGRFPRLWGIPCLAPLEGLDPGGLSAPPGEPGLLALIRLCLVRERQPLAVLLWDVLLGRTVRVGRARS